jgi:hypothetical protein
MASLIPTRFRPSTHCSCISVVLKRRGGGSVAISIPIGEIPNRGSLPRAYLYGFHTCGSARF